MKKSYTYLFLILTCLVGGLRADTNYGYICYSTMNIGDDIQAIAARRFLPKNSVGIDREFLATFTADEPLPTVVSGWYMHDKNSWYHPSLSPPEPHWPPSDSVDPFFISVYFWPHFHPVVFSEENIAYLKAHGPIGTRDLTTLEELQKRDIPSYFSGCLTLTLEKRNVKSNGCIYAVDISEDALKKLQTMTSRRILTPTHGIAKKLHVSEDIEARMAHAEGLLDQYAGAKCVVTTRLHAALPSLALGTPVLLIYSDYNNGRFKGLKDLVHHCTEREFLNGEFDFDVENPPENPKDYLPIRENLIALMEKWVASKR